jgi:hypothetical protein
VAIPKQANRARARAENTAEDRREAHRRTAEAVMRQTILPALTTVRDELHRPAQHAYVTVTPLSPTSAELTIARTPPAADDSADPAMPLRYVLAIAFDPQAITVKRIVNDKKGSFLGQTYVTSLRTQAIVDDVRRVWRRIEKNEAART